MNNPLAGDIGEEINEELLPATGAWLAGSDPGEKRFADIGVLELELGAKLPVRIAYETWGEYNGHNAVLLCHPLTGDSHACGIGGWWSDIVGPGKAIDTEKFYVVAPNVLGGCQGTTGPASLAADARPYGSRFPEITVRDQVRAEAALADFLGIQAWRFIAGASAGGQRVMEWAASFPQRTQSFAVLVSNAEATAEQIAFCRQQHAAILLDPAFRGGDYYDAEVGNGPHRGLCLARAIAHTTYRCHTELDSRFGNSPQAGEVTLAAGNTIAGFRRAGRFAAESYLDYHGNKLAARFDANSYLVLNRAMSTHSIGRGRGGTAAVLASLTMPALVVNVDSDRLFYPDDVAALAAALPGANGVATVTSKFGHDGFLIESAQVAKIIAEFLQREKI
ncbi:homoserine O-acetyltransferase MetX [Arcanobacterium hippocoleae]|nr:homoserine O-acetyltransferase [Arcanobacterium hippocoleae]